MGKKKNAVKKGSPIAIAYAEQQKKNKMAWTHNVYYFTQQETIDAACLALNEAFGFGADRLKKFTEVFSKKFAEMEDIRRADKDDEEREYSTQKIEDALKQACGKYYVPRSERYTNEYITDVSGNPVIWQ